RRGRGRRRRGRGLDNLEDRNGIGGFRRRPAAGELTPSRRDRYAELKPLETDRRSQTGAQTGAQAAKATENRAFCSRFTANSRGFLNRVRCSIPAGGIPLFKQNCCNGATSAGH